jgi:hypothetical protein
MSSRIMSHADLTSPIPTYEQVVDRLSQFTDDERSLAFSPEPPFEPSGAGDCRPGGNAGLNFNPETRRAKWVRARFRWHREQQKLAAAQVIRAKCPTDHHRVTTREVSYDGSNLWRCLSCRALIPSSSLVREDENGGAA